MKKFSDIAKALIFFGVLVCLAIVVAKIDPKKLAEEQHIEANSNS